MIQKFEPNGEQIRKIMRIWENSVIKAHKFIPKAYWKENYSVVKEKYLPAAQTYVFKEQDIIQGFISILDGKFIGALFVGIEYQRKGIGEKLLQFALKKYGNLRLAVYKKNKGAVDFYKKNGFAVIKERINEETKESEYIMAFEE